MIGIRLSKAAPLTTVIALTIAACGANGSAEIDETLDPAAAASEIVGVQGDVVVPGAGSETDGESTTTTAGDDSQSPIDLLTVQGEIIQDTDLLVGDCFNRIEGLQAGRRIAITARVNCDMPHANEVFHMFELEAPRASVYPGDTIMRDYARRLCYDHFEAFVGVIYELSVYEIEVFTPDRINFENDEARYRRVHCWLYRTDSEQVIGSARGTSI